MVVIVTDSACDLPERITLEYDIQIVPARILFGRKAYKDGVDLSQSQFYSKLESSYYHPSTTQASPHDFYQVFRKFEQNGEDILCITIPEAISAFIRSAREAAEEIHDVKIVVYNSGSVSSQQGIIVMAAARMVQLGYSIDEIVSKLNELKPQTRLYAVAATLDYLKRGGRITGVEYRVGSLLGVRPIITIENEEVESVDRQILGQMEKAMDKIIYMMKSEYTVEQPLECMIMHAQNISGASVMTEKLRANFNVINTTTTRIGPTIGANIGPGAVGVAISPAIESIL